MKRSFTTQGITDPDLLLQPYIEEEWKTMPKPTRDFLLGTPLESLTHHAMVRFWSAPKAAAYITYLATGKMRDESFSIALMYLRLGKTAEARAAILNGSFILDALVSSRSRSSAKRLRCIVLTRPLAFLRDG